MRWKAFEVQQPIVLLKKSMKLLHYPLVGGYKPSSCHILPQLTKEVLDLNKTWQKNVCHIDITMNSPVTLLQCIVSLRKKDCWSKHLLNIWRLGKNHLNKMSSQGQNQSIKKDSHLWIQNASSYQHTLPPRLKKLHCEQRCKHTAKQSIRDDQTWVNIRSCIRLSNQSQLPKSAL